MWPRTNLRRWGRIRVEDLELYGERVLHVERQQFVRQPILVGKPVVGRHLLKRFRGK
ncbi:MULTISPECIES: hypothetical protein [Dermacoccus]|uniref:hypothetical protein n=1 Tax=Dermacoccus TaxID=57495 RepID=UPI0018798F9B|nr:MULTISPECIES: hypothetical protein [Dermacoccus]MBE7371442.1 hypothetical protein [Dermacoccus barathri]